MLCTRQALFLIVPMAHLTSLYFQLGVSHSSACVLRVEWKVTHTDRSKLRFTHRLLSRADHCIQENLQNLDNRFSCKPINMLNACNSVLVVPILAVLFFKVPAKIKSLKLSLEDLMSSCSSLSKKETLTC